jgi:Flp pilus assembly protein TadG
MTLTLLVASALTIDGGRILAGRRAASNAAFSASRVGGQFVTVKPSSDVEINQPLAIAQAEAYLADQGFPDHSVSATPGTVTVTVHYRVSTVLLRMIGIDAKTVTATGVARPAIGITTEGG